MELFWQTQFPDFILFLLFRLEVFLFSFSMAYPFKRWGKSSYYSGARKSYKRSYGKSRFGGKKWFNRNNKSSYQMTNFQNVQITVNTTLSQSIITGSTGYQGLVSPATILTGAAMHSAMSNVYDQFRIRKVTVKVIPTGTSAGNQVYSTFYSILDRNGFPNPLPTLATLQTYSSYKQTPYAGTASNKAPTHWVSWENNTMFEKSRYFSTKMTPLSANLIMGTYLPSNATADVSLAYSLVWNFDISYRGIRADTSAISANVSQPE